MARAGPGAMYVVPNLNVAGQVPRRRHPIDSHALSEHFKCSMWSPRPPRCTRATLRAFVRRTRLDSTPTTAHATKGRPDTLPLKCSLCSICSVDHLHASDLALTCYHPWPLSHNPRVLAAHVFEEVSAQLGHVGNGKVVVVVVVVHVLGRVSWQCCWCSGGHRRSGRLWRRWNGCGAVWLTATSSLSMYAPSLAMRRRPRGCGGCSRRSPWPVRARRRNTVASDNNNNLSLLGCRQRQAGNKLKRGKERGEH
jgi:hypothetical protein